MRDEIVKPGRIGTGFKGDGSGKKGVRVIGA